MNVLVLVIFFIIGFVLIHITGWYTCTVHCFFFLFFLYLFISKIYLFYYNLSLLFANYCEVWRYSIAQKKQCWNGKMFNNRWLKMIKYKNYNFETPKTVNGKKILRNWNSFNIFIKRVATRLVAIQLIQINLLKIEFAREKKIVLII